MGKAKNITGKPAFYALLASLSWLAQATFPFPTLAQKTFLADDAPPASSAPVVGQPAANWLDQQDQSPLPASTPSQMTPQAMQQFQTPPRPEPPQFQTPQGQALTPTQMQMQMQTQPLSPPAIDITSAKFAKMDLSLTDAQFLESSVDSLHIIANDFDVKDGSLGGLILDAKGGIFKNTAFTLLHLEAQGDMHFDPEVLINNKTLEFRSPAQAQVQAVISQDAINRIVNAPFFLQHLSVTANKKVGMLAGLLGGNAPSLGVTLSDASVALGKSNHVVLGVKANVGLGSMGLPLPLQLDTKLGLSQGWIALSDTHLITSGQEISPLLSEFLVKKLNETHDWGWHSEDIAFSFSELKIVPNKQIVLKGTAQINRLRFGKRALSSENPITR